MLEIIVVLILHCKINVTAISSFRSYNTINMIPGFYHDNFNVLVATIKLMNISYIV